MKSTPPPGWQRPGQCLVIATVARSGSNYLCDLVTQTDALGRPDEFFGPHLLAMRFPGRGRTPEDCCAVMNEYGVTPNGVAAVKLMPYHLRSLQYALDFTEWFGIPQFVWLRRRDLLTQAISFEIAMQTLSFRSDEPVQREPRYSTRRIWRRIRQSNGEQGFWSLYFARQPIPPLELWYEDVVADPRGAVQRIADAMQVAIDPNRIDLASSTRRQSNAINDEWRARFLAETGGVDQWNYPDADWLDRIRMAREERRMWLRIERESDTPAAMRRRRNSASGRIVG